jgi:hypothetical protein
MNYLISILAIVILGPVVLAIAIGAWVLSVLLLIEFTKEAKEIF